MTAAPSTMPGVRPMKYMAPLYPEPKSRAAWR